MNRGLKLLILTAGATLVLLLQCGKIGIDKRDEHGMTALMRAAQSGNRQEAERLIGRGAKVDAAVPTRDLRELIAFLSWMQQLPHSDIGYTPLLYAAQGGHADIVRLLIDRGADVHHADRGGTTALDLAVWRSDLIVMRFLSAAGARPGARQLAMAVVHSTPETVSFLLQQRVDPDALASPKGERSGPAGSLPIILAAQRGDPAVVKLLIDAGSNVNAQDRNGWSALRWVRRPSSRRLENVDQIIELLQAAGARDSAGDRAAALFEAVGKKDVQRVREAIRAGANPNAKDDRGVPPLIYAGNQGQAEVVGALVDAGADVNASPEHDTTPLIAAITGGSIEAVKKLLAAGARVDQPDRIHRTPLQVASGGKRTEITSLLLASSATVDSGALAIAALSGSADQVRLLLTRGANPNAGNGHALSEAARGCHRHDNTEVIRLLLEGGASPMMKDGVEYTALHRAAALCQPEVVRLFLQHGADPNARDLSGSTPLISAASSGNLENARLLIGARADVNARDSEGRSALDHASRYPEVQQELRRAGAR